jgi:alpha-mannosidase
MHVMDTTDALKPQTWTSARAEMKKFLATGNGVPNGPKVTAIGHCHIDTAWLWRYQETRRKCIRSWSSQVAYMQDYPWFVFTASQAQQYEWVKEDAPSLFKQIQEMQKKGQFAVIGGTWIEMDANVPSGESIARQFLYGQRLFQKEFGVTCDTFWLPDTFGYTPQLPQMCRLSGISNFMSQKLSWNLINKFPHHTFIWEGLDGSQVVTHFPPTNDYNAQATAKELYKSVADYQQRSVSKHSLLVYGNGDGGGGPTREMIERLDKLKNTADFPQVEFRDPSKFFGDLKPTSHNLPVWVGELYFELHRGTYTTQALLKKLNRQSEQELRILEILSTVVSQITKSSSWSYPTEKISRVWKNTLL